MNNSEQQLNKLLLHYINNKELDELYISVALKSLAVSLIQVFVPIYLFKLGYSIQEISLYYLIYFTTVCFIGPLCMKLNSIIGIKKVLTLGTIVLGVYYILLNFLEQGSIHYLLVSLTFGISVALYYSAFHIQFSHVSNNKKEASEYSIFQIIIKLSSIIGPLIGAIFISKISFGILFFIVAGLLILSIIPLFFTKDIKTPKFKFSPKEIFRSDNWKKAVAYQAQGILDIASNVFWPLFIFLTLKKILSLGLIISLTSAIVIIFMYFLGKVSDEHKNKVLGVGIIMHSLSWVSRLLFLSPIGVFLNNTFSSLSNLAIDLPFSKYIYEESKLTKNVSNYFLFREYNLEMGRVIVLLIAYFTGSIYWVFILSFFATYSFSFLMKD